MDYESMSGQEIINRLREIDDYMDNVVVFWGGKKELRETLALVANNKGKEYTEEEALNASVILETQGAFDEFIQMVQDSFERGGINYMLSEKISAIMQEVADRSRNML
ncbi:MAG: hypothetical protein NTW27_14120 [Deltaproteobacteria bacterium]|jgi:hypothetical protein|nr:hypothetical protein [Deltaproteobacteria bacterium]